VTRSRPTPQRLILFSGEQAMEASSVTLMVVLGAPTETLTLRLGHNFTCQLEAPNKNHEAFTLRKIRGELSFPRQVPRRMGGGKSNHLGRIVDLGLLSQSTKSWGIWLAIEGDLRSLKNLNPWRRDKSQGKHLGNKPSPFYRWGTFMTVASNRAVLPDWGR
jgi:hypothetical protein